jgi:hypothetical protein
LKSRSASQERTSAFFIDRSSDSNARRELAELGKATHRIGSCGKQGKLLAQNGASAKLGSSAVYVTFEIKQLDIKKTTIG